MENNGRPFRRSNAVLTLPRMKQFLLALFLFGAVTNFSAGDDINSPQLKTLEAQHTVESTRTLIALANTSDPKQSLAAAKVLTLRLPAPAVDHGGYRSNMYDSGVLNYATDQRNQLAAISWDSSLSESVRALAGKLLAYNEPEAVNCAAIMIQSVGKPEDASLLLQTLDQQLKLTTSPRQDTSQSGLNYETPLNELLWAIVILESRGYDNSHPSSPAQTIAYLLSTKRYFPPEILKVSIASPYYPVRLSTLESLPTPLPDNCVQIVRHGLDDPDNGVCRTACIIAGKSGRKEFLKPIFNVIATRKEEYLLYQAGASVTQLGGEYEALPVWTDRLTTQPEIALLNLIHVLNLPGAAQQNQGDELDADECLALRSAWRKFLSMQADKLSHGKKFAYNDPAISTAMIGRELWWQLPNGKTWPPGAKTSRD